MAFEPTIIGRVRQCPHCELRFGDEWELEDHLATDHKIQNFKHVYLKDRETPAAH